MKKIIILNGVPYSGKTFYAHKLLEKYNNAAYIDVKKIYEKSIFKFKKLKRVRVKTSYLKVIKEAKKLIKKHDVVICEVVLIKEKTQKKYIKKMKLKGVGVECMTVKTSKELLMKNIKKRCKDNYEETYKEIVKMDKNLNIPKRSRFNIESTLIENGY